LPVGRLVGLTLCIGAVTTAKASDRQRLTPNVTTDPASAQFVYRDVENFLHAASLISSGQEAAAVIEEHYLDQASPGLQMFIEKYDLTVDRLVRAMSNHPQKYAALADTLAVLKSQEEAFRQMYAKMKEVMPDAVFPPTYFLVAGYRGIGSGSIEGPLISIEKESAETIQGDLAASLVHEMVHMQQLAAVNEAYFEIFSGDKRTLLALCIREGAATYFAELIAGGSEHKNLARDYLLTHERELWIAFRKEMFNSETGDWLWSEPSNPDQPRDVGYAIGARIVQTYYEAAPDKQEAVRRILSVTDYPQFLKASGYEARVGER
jgi:hypothetical protein